jgi:hypothetical protein
MSSSQIHIGWLLALGLSAAPALADEAKPASAPASAAREEPAKRPQVRTYTSVTVVSDPSQAPRLPSRMPPRELGDRPPRTDRPEATRERPEAVRELRQEIQEMRRGLRESDRSERTDRSEREQRSAATHPDATRSTAAERRNEHEHEKPERQHGK